ncbi:hypothetical protein ADK86_24095 [Streptomyces sp. NRRL F-5755]|uniref:hypothetical protein n=1 Tax=Streptomyces sp. NRRL F-5755 TaxID=1519475 RepID=UPI0006AF7F82|nr:hypothetical protein [Streptomyces sp. NRRL F-5755]KOT91061.1 hypothetical protein ADK86_24095 [Streptomyces sp. NRRL F-5755]
MRLLHLQLVGEVTAVGSARCQRVENDTELGFAGLVVTGHSREVAWQTIKDRSANPTVRKLIEHMQSSEAGRKALEQSRQEWAGLGLPPPWDPLANGS